MILSLITRLSLIVFAASVFTADVLAQSPAEAMPEAAATVSPENAEATSNAVENVGRIAIAKPWQMGMVEPASPVMEKLYDFHDFLLILITVVSLFVLGLMVYVCVRFREKANPIPSKTTHNTLVEVIWTLVPVIILVAIAIPSLRYLYYMDRVEGDADMTLKVVGYQWYWNYEYPDYGVQFDSYMKKDAELLEGEPRLLSVDNELVVPVGKKVRVLITASDVIHSWAMPAFGVKTDAVPGKLNETWFEVNEPGIYYGQCSELCGVGHGFMPIRIRAVSEEEFKAWIEGARARFSSNERLPEAMHVASIR